MADTQPLVSVIIPAFNCGKYLDAALRSVIGQDYPSKEIFVIDDGSSDETPQVLGRFEGAIQVIHQNNAGAAAARNAGMQRARGDFLAFLDADDLWFPGKLTAQVGYLQGHPEVGLVYTRWVSWIDDGTREYAAPAAAPAPAGAVAVDADQSGWIYPLLLLDSLVHTITVLVRRSVAEEVGTFDTTLRSGHDYDYWIRVSRLTQLHKLATPLAMHRLHGADSRTKPKPINYEYEVVNRAVERWGPEGPNGVAPDPWLLSRRMARLCHDFGRQHYREGHATIAHAAFIEALRQRPVSPMDWAYAGLSLIKSWRGG